MTATLIQGQRNEKLTANRSLERFLSPDRQKLLGFQEFPKNFNEVIINGKQAAGWDQDISDGDTVVIKLPSEQTPPSTGGIGVSSVAETPAPINTATQELNELRSKYERLREAATRLVSSTGLQTVRRDLQVSMDRVNILNNKIQEIRQSLTQIEECLQEITENIDASGINLSSGLELLNQSVSS